MNAIVIFYVRTCETTPSMCLSYCALKRALQCPLHGWVVVFFVAFFLSNFDGVLVFLAVQCT